MATTILTTPPNFRGNCFSSRNNFSSSSTSPCSKSHNFSSVTFVHRHPRRCRVSRDLKVSDIKNTTCKRVISKSRSGQFFVYASNGCEPSDIQTDTLEEEQSEEPIVEEIENGSVGGEEAEIKSERTDVEEPSSAVVASLQVYKDALAENDKSKVAKIEDFLKSIEDEKIDLEKKVTALTEELSSEKDRVLRISADFDNFRKRTERERLSLVSNAQGEVVENLLPVLDNFERAKAQIKIETEGEEKINNSYQSIYKQFVEILSSLGVVLVETIGKPFDPLLHEAIMREESTEYEEDLIIEEYRKGFQLGERLLRPSMVKVSAGPGPTKPETAEPSAEPDSVHGTTEEESAQD